jgi:RNA polymerase sigma-70 factor (ECF subfamily)
VNETPPALARGRENLRRADAESAALDAAARADLDRYASLFNARDWDGVRALVGDDCRLDLVSKSQRRGKQVGMYFGRYAEADVRLRVVRLEGRLALAAHLGDAPAPAYFILLSWEGGRVQSIRDFRYIPYIALEAEFEEV